ncbi:MAG: tetratricopeptide repeat protein, partial [Thermoleophilia bacterium]
GQPSGPVAADTSGAYRELVARANGLYDQGAQAFQSKNPSGAAQYFAAAATVYEAAWAKQPGDPNVGTDLATSLYYSGDTAAALKQVDAVLAKTPDFQSGRLNKGIYLQAASQDAQQNGQSAKATKLLAQARAELEKAVAIDPAAAAGKKAAEILKTL